MINKKGVSAVIATVLIILITVAATAILWRFVMPMMNVGSEAKCLDTIDQLKIIINGYTCKNTNNVSVQINRGSKDFSLSDIQILVVDSEGNAKSFNVLDNVTTLSPNGISKNDLPGVNEGRTYVVNTSGISSASVKVAAMINDASNKKISCDVSEAMILDSC